MTARPRIQEQSPRSSHVAGAGLAAACLLLQACTGFVNGDAPASGSAADSGSSAGGATSGPGTPPPSAEGDIRNLPLSPGPVAGALRLRGLTRIEYDNTVSAVLGERVAVASNWGAEVGDSGGFSTARPISGKEVEEYFAGAEQVAARVKASFARLWSCDTAAVGEKACVEQFVSRMGRAAFRRPLLDVEQADYTALFNELRTIHGSSLEDSAALVSEAILQSPSFMYHWELGPRRPSKDADGNVALGAHEVAARLAYFLTQAPPDAALAADADSGRALDPAILRAHAARLLESATSSSLFRVLVNKLLGFNADASGYTGIDGALRDSRERFVDATVGAKTGNIQSLMLGTQYFVNEQLAPLYGLSGVTGSELTQKDVDPEQRLGILTHADFLKFTGKADDSMPPRRGHRILTEFLCQQTPPMPAIPPELQRTEGQTMREFFEGTVQQQACAKGCHGTLDPLGFAFEHYGGSAWRETDQASGKPINARGTANLPFGDSVDYDGAPDLIRAIAESEEYRQCMTRQVFRMATGRVETGHDALGLQSALAAQRAAGDNLRETLADVIASEAFRKRALNEGELAE